MGEISVAGHLIYASAVSLFALSLMIFNRKWIFKNTRWKWFWISLITFTALYFLIVASACLQSIYLQLALQKFDLNGDGFFNGNEITGELKIAIQKVSSDTGRNYSFITGAIISGIISLIVLIIGKTSAFILLTKRH